MKTKELLDLAENPNLIEGIYNYCDRWCERCPFTSRCLNYAMGEKQFMDPETRDINNEAFWQQLKASFQLAIDLLREIAEEEGIDLDNLDSEEMQEWKAEEKRLGNRAMNQECVRMAKVYTEMVDEWFDSAKALFEEKEEELTMKHRLAVADPVKEAVMIKDVVEIIRWYQHQIWVKLMRAMRGKWQEERDAEFWKDYPKDSDGSAKVALIGMDRSLAAWAEMHHHFPEKEDDTLAILVHLERLRHQSEQAFPDARAFVRAGFDTIELYM